VVNHENPTIVETVLRIGAKATLPSPVRAFGLLSGPVVARQVHGDPKMQKRQLRKLSGKVQGVRRIEEAKGVLMRTRGINEAKAYDPLRDQAMSKRVSVSQGARRVSPLARW
jgi:AmiR/NasT family two-component response regulator